jgi:TPR repeat protein
VGYFTEMGIGCRRDPLEANMWYVKAAEAGDERAKHRLAAIRAAASGGNPMEVAAPKNAKMKKTPTEKLARVPRSEVASPKDDKECTVM